MARELYDARSRGKRNYHVPHAPLATRIHLFQSRTVDFYALGLILLALLVPLHKFWVIQLLLVLLLLSVPGFLLLRTLRIPSKVVADFPALVPCASISLLLFTGLALDLLGPLGIMAAPLRTAPVLCAIEVVCFILLLVSKDAGPEYDIQWRPAQSPMWFVLPLALPMAATVGTLRLNNGHSNKVALIALLLCTAALIVSMLYASRIDESILIVILFSVGLAAMLSFSLRGTLVYGFDIASEYQRLTETTTTGVWHLTHYKDAYGAMLSLTVMPSEIHFVTGVSDLMIFKLVYPLFGALFPIEIFALARRVVATKWAYAAAAIVIVQSGFMQELPALSRQEPAFALFGALVAVMLYRPKHRVSQWILVALLAFSMVVSHYSTTYVAITILGAAVALQWLVSWFRNIPRVTGAILLPFVASLAGAIIWYGPVTDSALVLSTFAQSLSSQGLDLVPAQSPGQNIISAYLDSGRQQYMSASQYQQAVHAEYVLGNSPITPLDDAGLPKYYLRDSTVPTPPVRLGLVHTGIGLVILIGQQLLNLLGAVGSFFLAFRRRSPFVARAVGFLGLGATVLLALVRLSGTFSTFYNSERALLQSLGVFSIACCWILQNLEQRLDRERRRRIGPLLMLTAVTVAAFMINSTSLLGAILGGSVQSNLASSGEDYERFVRTPQELAAASWLGTQVRPGQEPIYADRYAQLPLIAMTDLGGSLIQDVTPLTINQNAWVYASTANVVDGRARVFYKNYLVTYVFPSDFLNQNFNLVYSDGASEVFNR